VHRHGVRLVAPLVVDYSASRRLVVDYFTYTSIRVPRHVARLVTRIVARLVVDYFAYAAHLGASARRAAHRSSSTTSRRAGSSHGSLHRSSLTTWPTPRVRVPRHVTRPVSWLIVEYSVRCDFVLRPCWLYFSHARAS
jgi:hypothetical protein